MKIFNLLIVLFATVFQLDADQTAAIINPKSTVCFNVGGHIQFVNNYFRAEIEGVNLMASDEKFEFSALDSQSCISKTGHYHLHGCSQSEANATEMKPTLFIEAACIHNTPEDLVNKAITFTEVIKKPVPVYQKGEVISLTTINAIVTCVTKGEGKDRVLEGINAEQSDEEN